LIRAVLSSALDNLCALKRYRLQGIDIWGLTLTLSVLIEPTVLHQLGGQLSFILSFGLLWLKNQSFFKTNMMLNMLISPNLLSQTFAWQPLTILANLFVIPLFSYIVVPTVFLGVTCGMIDFKPGMDLCEWLLVFIKEAIALGVHLPFEIVSGEPNVWWLLITIIGTGALLVKATAKKWLCVSGMYILLAFGIGANNDTFIAFVDVKQGDATLWRSHNGENYLFDVGGDFKFLPNKNSKHSNFVAKQLVQVIRGYGIKQLDHLILSHQDIDHIGNFNEISQKISISNLYVPTGMTRTENYQRYIKPYLKVSTNVYEVLAGKSIGSAGCEVMHPFQAGRAQNEDSIVLKVWLLNQSFLLTGDLDVEGEKHVLDECKLGKIDILKCGHHGSRTSTSIRLLDAIKPKIGIISSGINNRFKHPHPEVLSALMQRRVMPYNTASVGMIWLDKQGIHTGL